MRPIHKILIANRGEIACRIMRTCREMGISTVAVCSEVDLYAPHVLAADEAVCLGPAPSRASYLNMPAILDAARSTGADAIHPGYGFLSENAAFALACEDAGFIFIGPTVAAITAMGSKRAAKELMASHQVPVVPGYNGEEQRPEILRQHALEISFPLLIKASAGGGGKGMRVVRREEELDDALAAAKREAVSAFGDPTLLLERYIDNPRHIEVQIFGDHQGNVVHLFERECSIQRRHQKIIEESPSVALTPQLRAQMTEAAVRAGQALGYTNAGTVEFILAPDGQFYFLEVNTRLQVEHPVTEAITGLDLVHLQIDVARGKPLPFKQEDITPTGHALECRLYAEDPQSGYLPSTGTLRDWYVPTAPWLRVDSGVALGTEVGIYYDPLLAKIITHGAHREEAISRMVWALSRMSVQGLIHNRDLLLAVIRHPEYGAGHIHTHFLDLHFTEASSRGREPNLQHDLEAVVATAVWDHLHRRAADPILPGVVSGWRNNRVRDQHVSYTLQQQEFSVHYRDLGEGRYRLTAGGWFLEVTVLGKDLQQGVGKLTLRLGDQVRTFRVAEGQGHLYLHTLHGTWQVGRVETFPERDDLAKVPGAVSPMPGRVLSIKVLEGAAVCAGQSLVILEAMKMEHNLASDIDGIVEKIHVNVGDIVEAGVNLVSVRETARTS